MKSCGLRINLLFTRYAQNCLESWNCSFTFTALLISIDPSDFSEV